jgi:copper chaperone CopZ
MDPAKPNQIEPADPFFNKRADQAILDKIEIAAEGEDTEKYLKRLKPVLMKVGGVRDVAPDLENDRIVVTFDTRKIHAPDLHDAILESSHNPGLANE